MRAGDLDIPNIIEYVEQPWGLGLRLYPVQRFILKMFYNLPLNDTDKNVCVPDIFNENIIYRLTEKEYLTYLFEEGRCNIKEQDHDRRTLILPCGRRGGKCVRTDTLIPTSKGLVAVADLDQGTGAEVQYITDPFQVVQPSGLVEPAYYYDGGLKETVVLQTKLGLEVTGSADRHQVVAMQSDGVPGWKKVVDLEPGDYVAIHRGAGVWGDEVDLLAYSPPKWGASAKLFDVPSVLDEDWTTLLGYLVGDGLWNYDNRVEVAVDHHETWEDLRELFTRLFRRYSVRKDKRRENTGCVYLASKPVRHFLDWCGFSLVATNETKQVPWVVMQSPQKVVCWFIRSLFEADGCVEGQKKVTLTSSSRLLVRQVQALLLNLGIVSGIRPKWNKKYERNYYTLTLQGLRSKQLFLDLIGFRSQKKQSQLEVSCRKSKEGGTAESIPFQRDWCRRLLNRIPDTRKQDQKTGQMISTDKVKSKVRRVFGPVVKDQSRNDLTYSRLERILAQPELQGFPETDHLRELADQDYFWVEVTDRQIELAEVADLSMPDDAEPSFVAGGVVNHNTFLSSTVASYETYRILHIADPYLYYGLARGNPFQVITVATDKEQAGILFSSVQTHFKSVGYFTDYLARHTQSVVTLQTAKDIDDYGRYDDTKGPASIKVGFRSCVAKGLRGPGNIVIILDEFAHFQDSSKRASSKSVWEAVTPSAASFTPKDPEDSTKKLKETTDGRVLAISSPGMRDGKFFELYYLGFQGGEGAGDILVIQAPSAEMNPTIPSQYLRTKYHEDPEVFMVEFGANFADRIRGWIERKEEVQKCVVEGRKPLKRSKGPKVSYDCGVDLGLVTDGSAITLSRPSGNGTSIVVDYHECVYAGQPLPPGVRDLFKHDWALDKDRLELEDIAEWIYQLSKRFIIRKGVLDQWNGIPLEQSLRRRGLNQFEAQRILTALASSMFQNTKMMLFDSRIELAEFEGKKGSSDSYLVEEICTLEAEQTSRNIVVVHAPKIVGMHDDRADSLVRSIWLSTERLRDTKFASDATKSSVFGHPRTKVDSLTQKIRKARQTGMAPQRGSALGIASRMRRR